MKCDAIVNSANKYPVIGDGCDRAIYAAAGEEKLLEARKEVGALDEGKAAVTHAFNLSARCIIHAVSLVYKEDDEAVEERLRNCYRNSLRLAKEHDCGCAYRSEYPSGAMACIRLEDEEIFYL